MPVSQTAGKRPVSINQNSDFRRAYARGKSVVHPALVTYCLKNRAGCVRIGITASKKIGNAVERNRARRVIKAAFRMLTVQPAGALDIVFVARARTVTTKSTMLLPVMAEHLRKLNVLKVGQP